MSILKLFANLASGSMKEKLPEAYGQQAVYLARVWNEPTWGVERLMRLFLCLAQFMFPVLLIRDLFGRYGAAGRKLAIEAYTVFKFVFPLASLWQGWYRNPFIVFLVIYFLADTFVHLLHLIFLADVHEAAASYRRSLLLLFLHYAETVFDFAVIYQAFGLLTSSDAFSSLYFSMVATTTVGFGDIVVKSRAGQAVVMTQLAVFVIFIVVFINYFSVENQRGPKHIKKEEV